MSPLLALVIALALGCLAGSVSELGAEAGVRLALVAAGLTIVAGRLAWAGHGAAALCVALPAVLGSGAGLGAVADAMAWSPLGLDIESLERRVASGDSVQLQGTLRRDAVR